MSKVNLLKLGHASPPPKAPVRNGKRPVQSSETITDEVALSSGARTTPSNKGLLTKVLSAGMMVTALAGCFAGGPTEALTGQQLTEPAVMEQVLPANPFELMRMKDGSVAVSADLKSDDAYVLAAGAAIRQDGGSDIALKTNEGTTLCEQAQALGGSCLNEEQVIVEDPSGPLLIETFAREGEAIHRLEAKPADGISAGGIELNKLPAGTEIFSDNGSGLLQHNGDLQQYPNF